MNCLVHIDIHRLQSPLPRVEHASAWLQIQAAHCIIHLVHASSCELYHLGSIPNSASDSQRELPQKYSFVPLLPHPQDSLYLLSAAEVTHG